MRTSALRWAVVGLMGLVIPACYFGGGGAAPTAEELASVPPGTNPALIIRNASNRTICYVNFSPASSSSWGTDQLGASETVPPGNIRGWRVPSNTYDLRVLDCNRTPLADDRGVIVEGDGVVVTYQ